MATKPLKTQIPSLTDLTLKVSRSEIASINSVVHKLLEIIKSPTSGAMDLKKEIEVDPPLSAKILRRANSAYYGVKRPVASIQEAIIFIGFNTVREMAYSLKVGEFFNKTEEIGGYSRKRLWEHSVAVALVAKNIYRREFRMEGNEIYSSALLHDLGIIVEEQFIPEGFATILDAVAGGASPHDAERSTLGYTHCDIARKLLESWNFPKDAVAPIAFHHNPFPLDEPPARPQLTVFLAEQFCLKNEIGFDPFLASDEPGGAKALELLKLNPKSVEFIVKDVVAELSRMRESGDL